MNFYNVVDSVVTPAMPVFANCAHQFELMSASEISSSAGPGTSETCSQSCGEIPDGVTSETCSQSCGEIPDGVTSETCSQSCGEIPDGVTSETCSQSCEEIPDGVTSETCSQSCAEMAASPQSGVRETSKNKNFAAPPQFQSASTAYQAAPAFLC